MVNTRSASRAQSAGPNSRGSPSPPTPSSKRSPDSPSPRPSRGVSGGKKKTDVSSRFSHVPTPVTLGWLAVSVPLVIWDTVYTLGRPHTMEGGWLHEPLWVPYQLYGEVDHVYGWKAYNSGNGFTSAQGLLNAVETAMYLWYIFAWFTSATTSTSTSTSTSMSMSMSMSLGTGGDGKVGGGTSAAVGAGAADKGPGMRRVMSGRAGALALMIGFSAAVMTMSKTVLYWANEYYSGFDNIGHNTTQDLIFLWIIPNGAWLVFPTYMIFSLGKSLIDGLAGQE